MGKKLILKGGGVLLGPPRKRAARGAFKLLPAPLRHRLLRGLIRLQPRLPDGVTLRLARTKEELEAAFRILHDSYVSMRFAQPHPSGMRVTIYHALPGTSTLIAVKDGEVLGTVSAIRDNPLGLPVDKIFDTSSLRRDGACLIEASALAIRREYRGNRGEILFPLLRYLFLYCTRNLGMDRMVIATHPARSDLYEALFFFQRFCPRTVRSYGFVNGAPADGLCMDVARTLRLLAARYGEKPSRRNIFSYFTSEGERYLLPEREYFKGSDPIMTPELLDYFFNEKTDLFSRLTPQEHRLLVTLYNDERYTKILPELPGPDRYGHRRRHPRFDVDCRARLLIDGSVTALSARVREVSAKGMRAFVKGPVQAGRRISIRALVARSSIAEAQGTFVWADRQGCCGIRLEKTCGNWNRFIAYLESDLAHPKLF